MPGAPRRPGRKLLCVSSELWCTAGFRSIFTVLEQLCCLRQVDMSEASLRPGRELAWLAALRERLLANVNASSAAITAYVGSFLHDIDQARVTGLASHACLFCCRQVGPILLRRWHTDGLKPGQLSALPGHFLCVCWQAIA